MMSHRFKKKLTLTLVIVLVCSNSYSAAPTSTEAGTSASSSSFWNSIMSYFKPTVPTGEGSSLLVTSGEAVETNHDVLVSTPTSGVKPTMLVEEPIPVKPALLVQEPDETNTSTNFDDAAKHGKLYTKHAYTADSKSQAMLIEEVDQDTAMLVQKTEDPNTVLYRVPEFPAPTVLYVSPDGELSKEEALKHQLKTRTQLVEEPEDKESKTMICLNPEDLTPPKPICREKPAPKHAQKKKKKAHHKKKTHKKAHHGKKKKNTVNNNDENGDGDAETNTDDGSSNN